jgi:hypothetical protein
LAVHIERGNDDGGETISVTMTLVVAVATFVVLSLTVIVNGIVAEYVPASRPLLSTISETPVLWPDFK